MMMWMICKFPPVLLTALAIDLYSTFGPLLYAYYELLNATWI